MGFPIALLISIPLKAFGTFQAYNIIQRYEIPPAIYVSCIACVSSVFFGAFHKALVPRTYMPTPRDFMKLALHAIWMASAALLWCMSLSRLHPLRMIVGEYLEYFFLFLFSTSLGWRSSHKMPTLETKRKVWSLYMAGLILLLGARNLFNYEVADDVEGEEGSMMDSMVGVALLVLLCASEVLRKNYKRKLDRDLGSENLVHVLSTWFMATLMFPSLLLYWRMHPDPLARVVLNTSGLSSLIANAFCVSGLPFFINSYVAMTKQETRLASRVSLTLSFTVAYVLHFLYHRHSYYQSPHQSPYGKGSNAAVRSVRLDAHDSNTTIPFIHHFTLHFDNVVIVAAFAFMLAGVRTSYNLGKGKESLPHVDSFDHLFRQDQIHHLAAQSVDQMGGALKTILQSGHTRKLLIFLVINQAFRLVEMAYGLIIGSYGLVEDAFHMLFDSASIGIALYAAYMAMWPSNQIYTYGYSRYEVLSGFTNGVFLIGFSIRIVVESIGRIINPRRIDPEHFLAVSIAGFLVNVVGLIFFHEAHPYGGLNRFATIQGRRARGHPSSHTSPRGTRNVDDYSTEGVFTKVVCWGARRR